MAIRREDLPIMLHEQQRVTAVPKEITPREDALVSARSLLEDVVRTHGNDFKTPEDFYALDIQQVGSAFSLVAADILQSDDAVISPWGASIKKTEDDQKIILSARFSSDNTEPGAETPSQIDLAHTIDGDTQIYSFSLNPSDWSEEHFTTPHIIPPGRLLRKPPLERIKNRWGDLRFMADVMLNWRENPVPEVRKGSFSPSYKNY